MKRLALWGIGKLGYELHRRNLTAPHPVELTLKNVIKCIDPLILDVGASAGQSIARFKRLWPGSTIHSFEPNPETFRLLSKQDEPCVTLNNIAISDVEGEATLFLGQTSDLDSLYETNAASSLCDFNRAARRGGVPVENITARVNSAVRVKTTTISKYVLSHAIDRVDLLKIDTQGHEVRCLAGAKQVLDRIGAIAVEISFWDYYKTDAASFYDIESQIRGAGFRLYSLPNVRSVNGKLTWLDAIYVR